MRSSDLDLPIAFLDLQFGNIDSKYVFRVLLFYICTNIFCINYSFRYYRENLYGKKSYFSWNPEIYCKNIQSFVIMSNICFIFFVHFFLYNFCKFIFIFGNTEIILHSIRRISAAEMFQRKILTKNTDRTNPVLGTPIEKILSKMENFAHRFWFKFQLIV